ncbi:hypothetical protein R1sor_020828 [Riccia sorocarpa]|uniref:DUF4283 domain-containing protein n=1 Tax=Riccia sorocarpa TaxID=122646 RepID=A0ABD3GI69_9MARC
MEAEYVRVGASNQAGVLDWLADEDGSRGVGHGNFGWGDEVGSPSAGGATDVAGDRVQQKAFGRPTRLTNTGRVVTQQAADPILQHVRSPADIEEEAGVEGTGKTHEPDWADGITWLMLEAELDTMPTLNSEDPGADTDVREIDLNVQKAVRRLGQLRKSAAVLQALESSPSRDRVVAWVRETMMQRRGVQVCQVKALARREFLIIFQTEAAKDLIMARPPSFIDGKLIRLLGWSERHKTKLGLS